ncbi:MAG: hypothetical protein E7440_06320 [Ruminococcaceae bacterium]|nr:hypothetical protein [Oscillospiraceae bacterium]
MKKRLMALLCAAVLCFSMLPVRAINVGDVYFTAVNLKLLPLSMDTMPTWVNGVLYVPASVFDNTVTGVDLGLYCSQSSTNNTVTLYSLKQMLVFDLTKGTAYDHHSGQSISARAVNRNGRIYLPVEKVCNFFGLEDSYNYTQYGYLVRIRSEAAGFNDADFMDAASVPMASSLQEFLRSQQPADNPKPPAVDPPKVDDDPKPPQDNEDEQPKARVQICLGFRCETGEGLERILDTLERKDSRGVFFFSSEQLVAQDDLVRRVVGSGHGIGLLADGEAAEESLSRMEKGNELLRHIARTAATGTLAPEEQREVLEEENWACWRETVNGIPRSNERTTAAIQRILRGIGTRSRTVRVTLDDSMATANLLPGLLDRMSQQGNREEFRVMLPMETMF